MKQHEPRTIIWLGFAWQNRCVFCALVSDDAAGSDHRDEKTKDISDDTRDRDERNGRRWIEWLDDLHRLDHVRPENEIENRLLPADEDKERPNHMPAADQRADHQPNLTGTRHCWLFEIKALPARLPEETRPRNSVGD